MAPRARIPVLAVAWVALLLGVATLLHAQSVSISEFAVPTTNSGLQSIVTGPDGALWYTEYGNKIGRATSSGIITEYSIPGSIAYGIASGPDGALWFTDINRQMIGRITTAGVITEFSIPTNNSYPSGIALGPDGALWFAEFFGNKIGRI